ncbi:APC family permease [Saccharopolyspora shandongensis]|uniref:APC family permease n=1 Tax=Saccharopolyspora shandongensis TaxID=418495 RepID=UPI003417BAD0
MTSPPQPSASSYGNLKRNITFPQALGVSFHQIVGGGVVALTGTAIALTGGGAPLAFAIAALAVIVYSLPVATLGSAMPVVGSRYTYAARLLSPSLGFATMWLSVIVTVQLSLMALTAAEYVHALFPEVPERPFALAVVTVFFLANLLGGVFSNRLGILLAFVMIAAFLMYSASGVPQVHWEVLGDIAPNGADDLIAAAAILTFATTGGTVVAELGGEMKRPGRDIPLSIIGGTVIAGLLYVCMAIPSVGVLPVSEVAGRPMSVVAQHLLSPGGFAFFIIGGAVVSVVGHINAQLLASTKPVLAAIGDGWFPRRLGTVNKRFGTPHWLLVVMYGIGVVPILAGFSVATIAKAASIAVSPMLAIMLVASWRLRTRRPDLHAAAPFKLGPALHLSSIVLGIAVLAVQTYFLIIKLTLGSAIALAGWMAVGVVWWMLRRRHVATVLASRDERGAVPVQSH